MSRGRIAVGGRLNDGENFEVNRTIVGRGTVDIGDLTVARSRLKSDEEAGELGITLSGRQISSIAPNSGAAKAELKVGDVITSIDGIDVTGDHAADVRVLLAAPVGTKVLLGLARGVTVPVILGPRTSP